MEIVRRTASWPILYAKKSLQVGNGPRPKNGCKQRERQRDGEEAKSASDNNSAEQSGGHAFRVKRLALPVLPVRRDSEQQVADASGKNTAPQYGREPRVRDWSKEKE